MLQLSIAELAASFADDETVYLAGASGEVNELTAMLIDPSVALADAHFITSFVPGINPRCLVRAQGSSRSTVFFMQPSLKAAREHGRVNFLPTGYFDILRYLCSPQTVLDTVVVQVAPPDAGGWCSLGPAVEFMPDVIERASRIVAVINRSLPSLPGSASVHMDRVHAVCYSDFPLSTYDIGPPSRQAEQLVEHLAPLIPDGATLQVGLGKVPARLIQALRERRHLALHTGMISDAVLDLAAAGALREERPIVATVAVGSRSLYPRLAELQGLRVTGVSETHSPQSLSSLRRFHAVNSALEVDLLGQVNAESLEGRYVSGPGGLPDFAHAAHADPDGLSIIALASTDAGGGISRVVPRLVGVPVTLAQHEVDVVVTEYGAAMLRGQTLDERARRLCAIAHPRHREALQRSLDQAPAMPMT